MQYRTFIIRFVMFVIAGFLVSSAYSADKINNKSSKNDRGLKVVRKNEYRRIALVIGNGNYQHTGQLANTVNDARLIAETLKEVGFELYGGKPQINLSRDDMLNAVEGFGDKISSGDTALFFYAGHGMQVKGENYLIPVNANIKNEAEVRVKSIDVSLLFAKLEGAKSKVNIVILDACRNNPFGRSFRSGYSGLAQIVAPSGTIVAFSTAPNQVAEDGSNGNSTYTHELARLIKSPGLRIEDVFKRVRISVEETTDGNQQPWENTSLKGDFSFVEGETDINERKMQEVEERIRQAEEKARRVEQQAAMAQKLQSEFSEDLYCAGTLSFYENGFGNGSPLKAKVTRLININKKTKKLTIDSVLGEKKTVAYLDDKKIISTEIQINKEVHGSLVDSENINIDQYTGEMTGTYLLANKTMYGSFEGICKKEKKAF